MEPRKSSSSSPSSLDPLLHLTSLSDECLHKHMVESGSQLLFHTRRFGGRLYLVNKRRIPEKKRFRDIYEYAAKLGGLEPKKVREFLRIGKHLEPCPKLMEVFMTGEVPWTRFKVIASHVTAETDALWAERVKELPREKLETLIQDITGRSQRPGRRAMFLPATDLEKAICNSEASGGKDGNAQGNVSRGRGKDAPGDLSRRRSLDSPECPSPSGAKSDLASVPAALPHGTDDPRNDGPEASMSPGPDDFRDSRVGLSLDPLVAHRFHAKLQMASRRAGRTLSQGEYMMMLLEQDERSLPADSRYIEVVVRDESSGKAWVETCQGPMPVDEEDLSQRKRWKEPIRIEEDLAEWEKDRTREKDRTKGGKMDSRSVPARLRRLIMSRDRGLCAVPGCRRVFMEIHHQDRFAKTGQHDPYRMHCVCERHHGLLHAGMIENEDDPPIRWRVSLQGRNPNRTPAVVQAIDRRVRTAVMCGVG